MKYLNPTPNASGAYPAPQSNSFPGCIELTDEQAAMLVTYNGFVTIEDGTVMPNTEAWEAWKAEQAELPEPEAPAPTEPEAPAPTELEQLRADVDYLSAMTGVSL